MSRLVVVTGTDTGVGKTVVTAALAACLGPGALVVKPTQTGVGVAGGTTYDDVPDVETVARLTGVAGVELTRLAKPLAPDTAARRADVAIPRVASHAARVRDLLADHETVIVEGAGGLLVRLDTDGGTLLDLVRDLGDLSPEVVLVVRAGLGTLNHTELTVSALRAAGVEPAGVVIGAWPASPSLAEECNRVDLPRVAGLPLLGVVPAGAGSLDRDTFRDAAPTWLTSRVVGGRAKEQQPRPARPHPAAAPPPPGGQPASRPPAAPGASSAGAVTPPASR